MLISNLQILICVLGWGTASQDLPQPTTPTTAPPTAGEPIACEDATPISTAAELLSALDAADAELKNFSATILYRKVQGLLGDVQTRRGKLYFQHDAETKIRKFCVKFRQLEMGAAIEEENLDFIFDGRWLVERLNDEKQFIRREVVRPGETFDALSLDGPFPLPIGQAKDTVLDRFTAALLPGETTGRLIDCYKLFLKPKTATRLNNRTGQLADESIADLTLWYDRKTLLPLQVVINETTGDSKTMKLVDVVLNATLADALFDTTPPGPSAGWRVTIEAFER